VRVAVSISGKKKQEEEEEDIQFVEEREISKRKKGSYFLREIERC